MKAPHKPTSNIEEFDAYLVSLEDEVVRLRNRTVDLKCQRNELPPIGKLPDDVLRELFRACKTLVSSSSTDEWATVTHVCHRWRTIALDDALLWSDIQSDDSAGWITAKIARSKGLPLSAASMDLCDVKESNQSVINRSRLVFSQLARLSSLVIDEEDEELLYRHLKSDILSTAAPLLQELTVTLGEVGTNFEIPSTFLSNNAPKLRKLCLSECYL